jgi:hypothetical protein
MVLDVGSWFREQRDTQSDADAAALAAAQALPDAPGTSTALAHEYLDKNLHGASRQITFSSENVANDTVTVEVDRDAPGFFAKLFGIDSVNVGAKATARAGGIDAAKWVAPIVVNIKHPKLNCGNSGGKPVPCFGDETEIELAHLHSPGSGDAAGAFGLINLDLSETGTVGSSTLGDWITAGFDQYMPLGIYNSVPSSMFNSTHVKDALAGRMQDTLLFPIYKSIKESGSNAEYDIAGWVGFKVSSFKATGSEGTVNGSFTKVIWEGIQSDTGNNMNYGTYTIQLVE